MSAGAAAMLAFSFSGAALVARRAGGWRHWIAALRGPLPGRLHVEIARIAVVGLVLSSSTAIWMTASTFDFRPDRHALLAAPAEVRGNTEFALEQMPTLRQMPVAELRELSIPYPGYATEVFTLKTDHGTGYLDQGTGVLFLRDPAVRDHFGKGGFGAWPRMMSHRIKGTFSHAPSAMPRCSIPGVFCAAETISVSHQRVALAIWRQNDANL